jgi:formylglycine-generating enzyme required for sulfatase activity
VRKENGDLESSILIKVANVHNDTTWVSLTFVTAGKRTVTATAHRTDKSLLSDAGTITIFGKTITLGTRPPDQTVNENGTASFTVSVVGDTPFTYKWLKDGDTVGTNGATLIINPVTTNSQGYYSCFITDKWGDTSTVGPARLTVTTNTAINHKPKLSWSGTRNVSPGQACMLYLSATDIDIGQTFTYSKLSGPGSLMDTIYQWTPTTADTGANRVVFQVADNGAPKMYDTLNLDIIVTAQLTAPVKVQGIKPVLKSNGGLLIVWNKVSNADSYTLYRSAAKSGFSPLPSVSDTFYVDSIRSADYYYFVIASNSKGSSIASDTVYSATVNTRPQWKHNPIVVDVNENATISIPPVDSCIDPDGDNVTFILLNRAPAHDTLLGPSTYSYSPTFDDSGTYPIKIIGTDGKLSDTLLMTVHVKNVNRRPTFVVDTPKTAYKIDASAQLAFKVRATDPDKDSVTYSILSAETNLPRKTAASLAGSSVAWQSQPGDSGNFTIVIAATDGKDTARAPVQVSIGKVNAPPTISIAGISRGQTLTVKEGDSLKFSVKVSDLDSMTGEKVFLKLVDKSPFACATRFAFDSSNGAFVFTPSYLCVKKDSLLAPDVKFVATDDGLNGTLPPLSDTFTIKIQVTNFNTKPIIMGVHDTIISETQTVNFKVSAIVDDGDAIKFGAQCLNQGWPKNATFDTTSGLFSWTTSNDDSGTYKIRFSANDGTVQDTATATIKVTNVNRKPVFTADNPRASYKIDAAGLLTFTVSATDPDLDQVSYFVNLSAATTLPHKTDCKLTGQTVTWQAMATDTGAWTVVVCATDGKDTTSAPVQVTVGKVNAPPVISIQGVTRGQTLSVQETKTLSFTVKISDPDTIMGEKLLLRMNDRTPFGCGTFAFDSTKGTFSFTPSYSCVAKDSIIATDVKFIASDDGMSGTLPTLSDTFSLKIMVTNLNRPPTITPTPDKAIDEGKPLSFAVTAGDPDAPPAPTVAAGWLKNGVVGATLPTGATFNGSSFSWTPSYGQAGVYSIVVTASDGMYSAYDTVVITVNNMSTKADFTPSATSGEYPLTVSFVNSSLNATTYFWDFGDGKTSTDKNPINTFTTPGNYTVKLLATGNTIDSMKKQIVASRPPAPTNLTADSGVTWIKLTWTKGINSVSDTVYYAEGDMVTAAGGTKIANAVSPCVIKNLKVGQKYSIAVRSTTVKGGVSDFGVVIRKTTASPSGMKKILAQTKTFNMGQDGIAGPVHSVTFTHNFWMDSTEVTKKDYISLMTATYPNFSATAPYPLPAIGNDYPEFNITWYDAILYCNARSKKDGLDTIYQYSSITGIPGNGCSLGNITYDSLKANGYHLPTEAQWEFACRGGTTTIYYWGNDTSLASQYEWYFPSTHSTDTSVALKKPNGFGLYDMLGNAMEYVNDYYDSTYSVWQPTDPLGPPLPSSTYIFIVCRGGNANRGPVACAGRSKALREYPWDYGACGFRVGYTEK